MPPDRAQRPPSRRHQHPRKAPGSKRLSAAADTAPCPVPTTRAASPGGRWAARSGPPPLAAPEPTSKDTPCPPPPTPPRPPAPPPRLSHGRRRGRLRGGRRTTCCRTAGGAPEPFRRLLAQRRLWGQLAEYQRSHRGQTTTTDMMDHLVATLGEELEDTYPDLWAAVEPDLLVAEAGLLHDPSRRPAGGLRPVPRSRPQRPPAAAHHHTACLGPPSAGSPPRHRRRHRAGGVMSTQTSPHIATRGVSSATEASSTTSREGARVVLDAAGLHLREVTVTDPDVLAGLRRHLAQHTHQPATAAGTTVDAAGTVDQAQVLAYVTTALAVGSRALTVVATSLDTGALDRSVADLTAKVETSTQQALRELTTAIGQATDSEHGTIPRTIATTLDKLADQVAGLVAGEDAPVRAAVTDSVRVVTEQALAEIQRAVGAQADAVRRVLATDAPGSPLHDLKTGLVERPQRVPPAAGEPAGRAAHRPRGRQGHHHDRRGRGRQEPPPRPGHRDHHPGRPRTARAHRRRPARGHRHHPRPPAPLPQGRRRHHPDPATRPGGGHHGRADRRRGQGPRTCPVRQQLEDAARGGPREPPSRRRARHRQDHRPDARPTPPARPRPGDVPAGLRPRHRRTRPALAVYHLLRAQAWHTTLTEGNGRHDVDLPRLKSTVTGLADALTGFDTLTRHTHAARRSLDQLDKTTTSLRADLHTRVQATLDALSPQAETAAA